MAASKFTPFPVENSITTLSNEGNELLKFQQMKFLNEGRLNELPKTEIYLQWPVT